MATFTKTILSGSTDGKGVAVAATASPGTTIHTGSSTATALHEVWLYAANDGSAGVNLTIQFGGTTTADEITAYIEPYTGLQLIAPGLILKGNATPLVIRAYAGTANVTSVFGYVNVIA